MSTRTPVIYAIVNVCNGKNYVGSAVRGLADRKYHHRRGLNAGNHHSIHLQRSWNKYGEDCFVWVVLERTNREEILAREQYWIDKLQACDKNRGYNISPTAGSNAGCDFYQSEAFKEKHRQKAKRMKLGHSHPPRTKQHAINQGRTQTKLTDKQVARIRERLVVGDQQAIIAKRYGVCQQTISNIARNRGVVYGGESRKKYKAKPRSKITDTDRTKVREMYAGGMTQMEIAAETGYSQGVVSNIVTDRE